MSKDKIKKGEEEELVREAMSLSGKSGTVHDTELHSQQFKKQ